MAAKIHQHKRGLLFLAPAFALTLAASNYCLLVYLNIKKLNRENARHAATFDRPAF